MLAVGLVGCSPPSSPATQFPRAAHFADGSVALADGLASAGMVGVQPLHPLVVRARIGKSAAGTTIGVALGNDRGRYSARWQADGNVVLYLDRDGGASLQPLKFTRFERAAAGVHDIALIAFPRGRQTVFTIVADGRTVLSDADPALNLPGGLLRAYVLTGDDLGRVYAFSAGDESKGR